MENWWVELSEGRQILAEEKIQTSIFQEDSLFYLLFLTATMPLYRVFGNAPGSTNSENHKKSFITLGKWMTSRYLQKREKKKETRDTKTTNKKIQTGFRSGIQHKNMAGL